MSQRHAAVLDRWIVALARARDGVACRDNRATRSHGELFDLAHRRARLLLSQGLCPEQRVVVMLSSGVDQATWIAATMLAGGCVVPIGLHQPEERLRTLVGLADPATVIVDAGTRQLAGGRVSHDGAHPGVDGAAPLPASDLARAAYVCFTSGSTGRPKGVVVTHRVLAHTTGEMVAYLDLMRRPRTHVLATSWSFDVAMMDLWLALATGGTLFVPDRADLLGPALVDTVAGIDAPIVHGVPSLFGAFSQRDFGRLPPSTTVMLGGESVPKTLLESLCEHTDMHAVYGITETGVITTTHKVTSASTPEIIGHPLPGVDCVVTDPAGRPVPAGSPGELRIGGPVVARGYLNDPAGTASRFVAGEHGVRWYRTSDLVSRRPDGTLTFHGRIDQQIKIRGHRVEPAEVEQTMLSLPGVRQAAVVVKEHPAGECVLVCYLAGTGIEPGALRLELAMRVPDWMCPAVMVVLPSLPTTVTGKVDRPALPEPRWPTGADAADEDEPEANETERTIGTMWRQLLGGPRVGAGDNFVALGGHSLTAAQLSTAMRDQLGVTIPVPDVLAAPSLRELAKLADRSVRGEPGERTAPGAPTPGQRQLWLHQQLAGTDGIYNLVVAVQLLGPLQVTALQRALHAVERRHPALRMCFAFDGDELTSVARRAAGRPLVVRSTEPSRAIRLAGARAIDVSEEPPWNYQLIVVGPAAHMLLLTFHHIAVDGVAAYRLLEQIAHAYSVVVDPARRGSATVAAAHRWSPLGAGTTDDSAFWAEMMRDAPEPARLPGQRPAADVADFAGFRVPVDLPGIQIDVLGRAAAARGATPQALALSAFLRTVAGLTESRDLTIGVPISRRGVGVGFEEIGQFVNVLPVRFRLPEDLSATGCLEVVSRTMRAAQRHCGTDPAEILEVTRRQQGVAVGDPFRMVFAWEDDRANPSFAGLDTSWAVEFVGWSQVDLTVELAGHGGAVAGQLIGRRASSAEVDVDKLIAALTECMAELTVTEAHR